MSTILEWLGEYSVPMVVLLALGSALIYVGRLVVDRAVATQFDRYKQEIELRLKRRSDFEQRVLLDRYELVTELALRLERISTDVNRVRQGIEVEGLIVGKDCVPLTEVSQDIESKRHLLTERFYTIFRDLVQLMLEMVRANAAEYSETTQQFRSKMRELQDAIANVFGLEQISWDQL